MADRIMNGSLASIKQEDYPSRYERDGQEIVNMVKAVLKLKEEMNIS